MAGAVYSVGIIGAQELKEAFKLLSDDFGPKDQQKILVKAVRESMQPALLTAKANVPIDTGALRESLRIEARKPNRRDKRSKYIYEGDTVIATVTTAPGKVLAKRKFYNYAQSYKEKRDIYSTGIQSDARSIAMEFGTAKVPAKPYLRPALESNAPRIVNNLGAILKVHIEKYKAKQAAKLKKG